MVCGFAACFLLFFDAWWWSYGSYGSYNLGTYKVVPPSHVNVGEHNPNNYRYNPLINPSEIVLMFTNWTLTNWGTTLYQNSMLNHVEPVNFFCIESYGFSFMIF